MGPELVFGLVYGAGTDAKPIERIRVAPRGYPQYFEFDDLLRPRRNERGEAQQLRNRANVLPLVLIDGGPWGFGGRILPDSQIAASESVAAHKFAQLAREKNLTLEPDKESNA